MLSSGSGKVESLQTHSPDRRTQLLKTTREHVNIIDAFHQLGSYRAAARGSGLSGGIGDPHRTSFELQLNSDMAIWLAGAASADGKRTVGGRITDVSGRSTDSGTR